MEGNVVLAAVEVSKYGDCSLNIYTLPSSSFELSPSSSSSSSYQAPANRGKLKFHIREAIALSEWVSDFCWIDKKIFVAFCDSTFQAISVSMRNERGEEKKKAEKGRRGGGGGKGGGVGQLISDFQRTLTFLSRDKEGAHRENDDVLDPKLEREKILSSSEEVTFSSDIIAYDNFQTLTIVATKDDKIQLWQEKALKGSISVNAKVTDVAICKSPTLDLDGDKCGDDDDDDDDDEGAEEEEEKIDECKEMLVAVGCQHGELLLIKWIWRN